MGFYSFYRSTRGLLLEHISSRNQKPSPEISDEVRVKHIELLLRKLGQQSIPAQYESMPRGYIADMINLRCGFRMANFSLTRDIT